VRKCQRAQSINDLASYGGGKNVHSADKGSKVGGFASDTRLAVGGLSCLRHPRYLHPATHVISYVAHRRQYIARCCLGQYFCYLHRNAEFVAFFSQKP